MSLPIMLAKHGTQWRYTVNPPARRAGGTKWDAGPASDWCQTERRANLKVLLPLVRVMLDPGLGRIERQKELHRIAKREGLCNRRRHWPRRPDAA